MIALLDYVRVNFLGVKSFELFGFAKNSQTFFS